MSGRARCAIRRLRAMTGAVRDAVARVLGVPDYGAYLAHINSAHPEIVPLSRAEFVTERLTVRYSRPGARCC
jgi:uncharacterized short protein YbdD (DUF466 family)